MFIAFEIADPSIMCVDFHCSSVEWGLIKIVLCYTKETICYYKVLNIT